MFSGHCLLGPHRAEKPRHFLVEKPSRIEAFIRKPWMIGFPTGDFSPYAYQVGVSLETMGQPARNSTDAIGAVINAKARVRCPN